MAGTGAVLGIELATALRLAELAGYDLNELAHLLPAGSAGLAAGFRKLTG